MSNSSVTADWEFAQSLISGDEEAFVEFENQCRPYLIAVLRKRGASETEADDIVADVVSDCVSRPERPLLSGFEGRCSLRGWLSTIATRRWIDRRRKDKFRAEVTISNGEVDASMDSFTSPTIRQPDTVLIDLLRDAIDGGFDACPAESLLHLRLVYLHGFSQRNLAQVWGCHESKISRSVNAAMACIRKTVLDDISRRDPNIHLSWEDFVDLCAHGDLSIL